MCPPSAQCAGCCHALPVSVRQEGMCSRGVASCTARDGAQDHRTDGSVRRLDCVETPPGGQTREGGATALASKTAPSWREPQELCWSLGSLPSAWRGGY